jgi:hypothetical protein
MEVLFFRTIDFPPDKVIQRFVIRSLKTPKAIELVYIPHFLFTYTIKTTSLFGRKNAFQGMMLVDLIQGEPASISFQTKISVPTELVEDFPFLKRVNNLLPNKKIKLNVNIKKQELPEESLLPAILKPEEAVDSARNLFKYDLWRLAGGFQFRQVEIRPDIDGLTVFYPTWLVYYLDRKGHTGFKAYDGLTLEKETGNFLVAIKKGLWEKHLFELKLKEPKEAG